jgi:lipid-binding SYLF domain-containing protein
MVSLLVLGTLAGCSTAPRTEEKKQTLEDRAQAKLDAFKQENPGMSSILDGSYGYAIFPSVGKGGLIVGGAYGKGTVYEQGKMIGYADLTQATVGAQLGGQTYAELIVFKDETAMNRFKNNQLAFTAQATAVALKAGAAVTAKFEHGVAVFTEPNEGLMAEAAVGGQKFTFVSVNNAPGSTTEPAAETSATTMPSEQ